MSQGQLVTRKGQLNDKIRDIVFASHAYFSNYLPQIMEFIYTKYPNYYENIEEAMKNPGMVRSLTPRVPIPLEYFLNEIRQALESKSSINLLTGLRKCDIKDRKEGFICNPYTGRWVEPTGTVANELIKTFGLDQLMEFSHSMARMTKKERKAILETLSSDLRQQRYDNQ